MTGVIEALEWNINSAGGGSRQGWERSGGWGGMANERFYPGRADDGWTHFRRGRNTFVLVFMNGDRNATEFVIFFVSSQVNKE